MLLSFWAWPTTIVPARGFFFWYGATHACAGYPHHEKTQLTPACLPGIRDTVERYVEYTRMIFEKFDLKCFAPQNEQD